MGAALCTYAAVLSGDFCRRASCDVPTNGYPKLLAGHLHRLALAMVGTRGFVSVYEVQHKQFFGLHSQPEAVVRDISDSPNK